MSPLVLLLAEVDLVLEKGHGKENSGRPHSSSGSKIVLTLLTEVVAVHMGLPAIQVRGTGFQLLAGCRQRSSGLIGQFVTCLGRWRGVRGSDIGSDGGTLAAGTPTAAD